MLYSEEVQRKNKLVASYLVYNMNKGYFNTSTVMETFMRKVIIIYESKVGRREGSNLVLVRFKKLLKKLQVAEHYKPSLI